MTIGNVIIGLQIFAKHRGDESHSVCAEHDELCVGIDLDPSELTERERTDLNDAGWHWTGEYWRAYV